MLRRTKDLEVSILRGEAGEAPLEARVGVPFCEGALDPALNLVLRQRG